ncbi:MAG TPA: hypothetical protein VFS52_09500 [Steroidobacteraceae bacterium]|nr:hypothetical protein [Steroidobacteraceae bacterium]
MITIRPDYCSQTLLNEQRPDTRRSICAGRAANPRRHAICGLVTRVSEHTKRKRACIRGAARSAH